MDETFNKLFNAFQEKHGKIKDSLHYLMVEYLKAGWDYERIFKQLLIDKPKLRKIEREMKKISEFTKEELIVHMKASGEYNRSDRESRAWARAFELYNQSQGAVDMDCSKCWDRVKEWLKK